jgi:hypothetical protein
VASASIETRPIAIQPKKIEEEIEGGTHLLSFISGFVNVVKVGMISTRLAQQILKVALITGQPLNLSNKLTQNKKKEEN